MPVSFALWILRLQIYSAASGNVVVECTICGGTRGSRIILYWVRLADVIEIREKLTNQTSGEEQEAVCAWG